MSRRGRGALLTAGAFVAGAAIAAHFAAPELARRHLIATLSERSGLAVDLGAVSLGWGSAALHGLRMSGRRGASDLDAEFIEVQVTFDPAALPNGLLAATSEVRVRGGTIAVSVRDRGEEEAPARSAARRPSLPAIAVDDVSLAFADAGGVLVRVEQLSARYDDGEAEAEASRVRIEGGPTWTLAEASVALVRSESRWQVRAVGLRGAAISLAGTERARRTRLAALLEDLRGGAAGHTRPTSDEEATPTADDLLERLTVDFSASLQDTALSVAPGLEGDAAPLALGVRALSASVQRRGSTFLTEGHASPEEGGRVAWDLDLEPLALLASGEIDLEAISVALLAPVLPELPFDAPEQASVSGSLRLEQAGPDEVRGSGSLDVRRLGFSHPRLSASPVRGIDLGVRGTASWTPASRTLDIEELFVRSPSDGAGAVEVRLEGTVTRLAERYSADLHARLESTPCDDAVHAIPADLLGELVAMRLDGRIGGSIDLHVDSTDLDATTLRMQVADGCRFVSVPPFAEPARFAEPFHHRAVENDGDVFEMDTGPGTLAWTPIAAVSPFLVHAVVTHEDASFFRHHGFAPWAIRDALVENLRAGRYVRGASTITMQLVKNAFLHREKTLARKVQEVLLTWWVETAMTKERILELYLNVIELGDGVYGIREAARSWFGREPTELSAAESVYLALILPNPPAFAAEHRAEGRPPPPFRRRMASFLRHLGREGRYDAAAVDAGLTEIEALRFVSPDGPPAPARVLLGSCAALPIEGHAGMLGGDLVDVSDDGADHEGGPGPLDEASWDRWEEVVP